MNTLSKTITADFYTDETGYETLKTYWGAITCKQRLSSSHYALMSILQGHNWTKGLTPIGQVPQPKKGESVAYYRQTKDKDGNLCPLKEHLINKSGRRKLENGILPDQERNNIVRIIQRGNTEFLLKPFGGLVTVETLDRIRLLIRAEGDAYSGVQAPRVYFTPQPTAQQVQALV